MEQRTRRDLLGTLAGGTAVALAGCGGDGGAETADPGGETTTGATRTATGELPVDGEVRRYRYDDRNSGVADAETPGEDFELAWTYETDGKVQTSPAVADGTAYVGDRAGTFHAVDLESGDREWAVDVADDLGRGVDASPTVVDDLIVFGGATDSDATAARVVAVDRTDGSEAWDQDLGRFARAAPTVVDGYVYAGGDEGVHCLDLATGEAEWFFRTSDVEGAPANDTVFGAVAVVDGRVVAATRSGAVHALDATTGDREWTARATQEIKGDVTVANGTVFVGSFDERVYAFDLETGTEEWQYDMGDRVPTSPAATEEVVYVGNKDGDVAALTAADGEEAWTTSVEGDVLGAPVLAGDSLVVGTRRPGGIVALDAETGDQRWTFETVGTVGAPLTAFDSALLVPTLGDRVYALYD